jgi:hypothetical protein
MDGKANRNFSIGVWVTKQNNGGKKVSLTFLLLFVTLLHS